MSLQFHDFLTFDCCFKKFKLIYGLGTFFCKMVIGSGKEITIYRDNFYTYSLSILEFNLPCKIKLKCDLILGLTSGYDIFAFFQTDFRKGREGGWWWWWWGTFCWNADGCQKKGTKIVNLPTS